ncbi:MAG: hypothetical protein HQ515_20945 [Phycisphaeraceae bacterium]|nr:hypothetical protein [Phycisphaeraceae bacterium]
MQCQRCQFENMPGQPRCFKCNSILEDQKNIADVHPPRMPSWQRPFRRVSRLLRRGKVDPDRDRRPNNQLAWMNKHRFLLWTVIRGIIPGLAHARQKRFRQIRWYMAGWLLCMALAGWMFSLPLSWTFLGMAAALHAWIALDMGARDTLDNTLDRLWVLMVTFALIFVAYALLIRVMPRDFSFQRTPLMIPSAEIQGGDMLLLRDVEDPSQILPRGTLVQFRAAAIGRGDRVDAIGQIVGLPNEVVTIHERVYYVNGMKLAVEEYPVPGWLTSAHHQIGVRPGEYFISSEYRVRGRQNRMNQVIKELCLVSGSEVESRATMLWWPLHRRHSLRQD